MARLSASATSPAVEAAGVGRGYGRRLVLDDLTFEHGAQTVLAVLGPNGSGKSTLLQLLATLTLPQQGSLRLLGVDVTDWRHLRGLRRRIGYLPQGFGYYSSFTALEFVQYVAWTREVPAKRRKALGQAALEQVDLGGHARQRLKTMSGGMLRRVGIASAIVNEPGLVILDEPTVGLDPLQRDTFYGIIRRLATDRAIVLSTHLVEDVEQVADRVLLLGRDRTFLGTVDQMRSEHHSGDLRQAYLELAQSE